MLPSDNRAYCETAACKSLQLVTTLRFSITRVNGYFVGKIVERIDESEAIPLEGKVGIAIFMHCLTPHASLNTSDRPRRTLILSYRTADAFPLYVGEVTHEAEEYVWLVRGMAGRSARFAFPVFSNTTSKTKNRVAV